MTPSQEISAFRTEHEAAFAGEPEPVATADDVTAMSADRLRLRMMAGARGAVAARKELQRRMTAALRREVDAA